MVKQRWGLNISNLISDMQTSYFKCISALFCILFSQTTTTQCLLDSNPCYHVLSCAIKSVLDSGYLRVLNVLAWQVGVGVGENLLMFNVEAVSLLGKHWKRLSEEGKVC